MVAFISPNVTEALQRGIRQFFKEEQRLWKERIEVCLTNPAAARARTSPAPMPSAPTGGYKKILLA